MMKQNKVLNYFSVTLTALLVGAAVLVILRTTRRQPAPAMTADQTLKAKAKEDRRFILTENPVGPGGYANLSALVGESAAVLVGTPQTNISRLKTDGTNITLDYQVKVEYVYKGNLQESDIVTISLPGGMVKFEDGSTAEVRTPGFRKMQDGKPTRSFSLRTPITPLCRSVVHKEFSRSRLRTSRGPLSLTRWFLTIRC
jgi:hypothetical protein